MRNRIRKILCLLGISFWVLFGNYVYATEMIAIDEEAFPDENFRERMSWETVDVNQDGYLSEEERENVTELGFSDVVDATGLELFPNVTKVSFIRGLEKVDFSNNTKIKSLAFNYCYLDSLDVSALVDLETLNTFSCELKEIDLTQNVNLVNLYMQYNQLQEIDLSQNAKLEIIVLMDNQLRKIDLSNNVKLNYAVLYNNKLTSLLLGDNIWLYGLNCHSNQLKELDLSGAIRLKSVTAHSNPLRKVTLSGYQGEANFNNCQLVAVDTTGCRFLMSGVSTYYTIADFQVKDNCLPVQVGNNCRVYYANLIGFDSSKVESITGGTCEDGYILWDGVSETIEYVYDIGNDATRTFSIQPTRDEIQEDIADNGLTYIENDSDVNNEDDNDEEGGSDEEGTSEEDGSGEGEETGGETGNGGDSNNGTETGDSNNITENDGVVDGVQTEVVSMQNVKMATISNQVYCGQAITPALSVFYNGDTLVADQDYILSYRNNVDVGTAQVTIQGCGNYTGTKTLAFDIIPFDASKLSTTLKGKDGKIYRAIYTKKAIKLKTAFKIATTNNGQKVYLQPKEGTDYTVRFKNNKKIGTASIIYTFKGNYTGTLTKNFQIVPPKTKVKGIKKTSTGLKITWKKVSSCDRYEVYRANSKKGNYKKIATVEGKKKCTYTDKKTKKGKKYYYKVKACKKVKGQIYKSDFSNVKKGKR